MILDHIGNAHRYHAVHPLFKAAFEFLRTAPLCRIPEGRHAIDGDRLYASVSRGEGRSREGALLEAHRQYIDIQFILKGIDTMGWKPRDRCSRPAGEYDPVRDIEFYEDTPDLWIPVQLDMFAVFFPEDAHLPLISSDRIDKVVLKIAVDTVK